MKLPIKRETAQALVDGEALVLRERDVSTWSSDPSVNLENLTEAGRELVIQQEPLLRKKIESYLKALADPTGQKIGTLQNVPALVRALMTTVPGHWLFEPQEDNQMLAWLVAECKYSQGERGAPAHATITLTALTNSSSGNVTQGIHIDRAAISGKTIIGLLNERGYFLATPEMVADYRTEIEQLNKLVPLVGHQVNLIGRAEKRERGDRWWREAPVELEVDGQPTRAVLDAENPECRERKSGREASLPDMWAAENDSGDEDTASEVPIHPFILAFSFRHHTWVNVHVANIREYEWRDEIQESLVLPGDSKRLIRLLIEATGNRMDDIVSGKSSGVIVLASGPPGVGKTLTAEVTSELLHKPLYSVQCSQLGTKQDILEERLIQALSRAQRWGAVLLIDEADVYVRERGPDIQQNAIVGVFLRTLEYYSGFLFLTTNRATCVDDAILSRCTAHVRYQLPSEEDGRRIAEVQCAALGIPATEHTVAGLIRDHPGLSGRDIRSVLKLARFVALSEGKEIDQETIRFCMSYQDVQADPT